MSGSFRLLIRRLATNSQDIHELDATSAEAHGARGRTIDSVEDLARLVGEQISDRVADEFAESVRGKRERLQRFLVGTNDALEVGRDRICLRIRRERVLL